MATSGTGSGPWTLRETALLFNYADECLRDNKDYRTTIGKRVLDDSGRTTTWSGVEAKLYRALKKFANKPPMKDVLRLGTSCLDLSQLSDELRNLVAEMNRQRMDLNLQRLVEATSKSSGKVTSSTSDAQTSRQDKPQMTKPRAPKRRYREMTVSDTESHKDDLNDAEYMEGDFLVEATHPAKRARKVKQPENMGPQVTAMESVAPRPTWKGKGPARAVVDLDEGSPPFPNTVAPEESLTASKALEAPEILQKHPLSQPEAASGLTRKRKAPMEEETNQGNILLRPSKRLVTDNMPSATLGRTNVAVDYSNNNKGGYYPLPKGIPESERLAHLPPLADQMVGVHRQLDDLRYLVFFLMQKHVEGQNMLSKEMRSRLDKVETNMRQDPGTLSDTVLNLLATSNREVAELHQMFYSTLGYVDPAQPPKFPQEKVHKVDWDWTRLRAGIQARFTTKDRLVIEGPLPSAHSAGYIASTIDDMLEDSKERPNLFSKVKGHLECPQAAQSLVSALVCLWLFGGPDPQCKGFHTDFVRKQYEVKAQSDGLEEVQRMDKMGFSRVFADKTFQDIEMPKFWDKLLTRLVSVIKQACPAAGYDGSLNWEGWADGALKLKQKLLISPHDYRIHFCPPGIKFDPTWMEAEDQFGLSLKEHEAKDKDILLCLFPALVQQEPKPFEKDAPFTDALVENKNFFPSWEEKHNFDPKQVISKATVFVKYEGDVTNA